MKAVNQLSMGGTQDFWASMIARSYLGAFSKRRDVLAARTKKMDVLSMFVPLVRQANRTLVFTNTIDSAAKAADVFRSMGISASNFDSNLPKEERKNLLEWFRKGKLQLLAAPKILDEGIDIPEADLGIILAASHSKRQMIQRMGRIIRPKKDGRIATFIILYVRNTNEDFSQHCFF